MQHLVLGFGETQGYATQIPYYWYNYVAIWAQFLRDFFHQKNLPKRLLGLDIRAGDIQFSTGEVDSAGIR